MYTRVQSTLSRWSSEQSCHNNIYCPKVCNSDIDRLITWMVKEIYDCLMNCIIYIRRIEISSPTSRWCCKRFCVREVMNALKLNYLYLTHNIKHSECYQSRTKGSQDVSLCVCISFMITCLIWLSSLYMKAFYQRLWSICLWTFM